MPRDPSNSVRLSRRRSTITNRVKFEFWSMIVSACLILFIISSSIICIRMSISSQKENGLQCSASTDRHMENITDSVLSDITNYPPGSYWEDENGTIWGCPCLIKPCLYVCCTMKNESDAHVGNESTCLNKNASFNPDLSQIYSSENKNILTRVNVARDHFYTIAGKDTCKEGRYPLDEEDMNRTYIFDDGSLFTNNEMKKNEEFCVETVEPSVNVIEVCHPDPKLVERHPKSYVRVIGMITTVVCLAVVLLTLSVLPQLIYPYGKPLICYFVTLAAAFILTIGLELTDARFPGFFCPLYAFATHFFVLAAFFWLNVLCFDIWWVFSGLMPLRGSQKSAENYKFLLYSLYAWGVPLAIVLLAALIQYLPGLPDFLIKPDLGVNLCYFENREAIMLYQYLPLGVLVYLNTVMFIITALRFKIHSRSVRHLQRGDSRRHIGAKKSTGDEQRFNLYLKLSIMMGLNWAFEILDFLIDSDSWIWIIPELFNVFQGLLYLQQFVCQRRILHLLNMKLCPRVVLVAAVESARTSSSTRSTSCRRRPTLTQSTDIVCSEPEPCKTKCTPL